MVNTIFKILFSIERNQRPITCFGRERLAAKNHSKKDPPSCKHHVCISQESHSTSSWIDWETCWKQNTNCTIQIRPNCCLLLSVFFHSNFMHQSLTKSLNSSALQSPVLRGREHTQGFVCGYNICAKLQNMYIWLYIEQKQLTDLSICNQLPIS